MKITPEPLTEPGHVATAPGSRLSRLTFDTGSAYETCAKAGCPPGKAGWYRARAPLPGAARIAPERN
ncbi:MAG: hypothetical protein CBC11_002970 [Proteobacteria bacterium TMED51]|nr:MAG: hypothetical protein CBC11_002970 [Proteobacteria bacterium TMED51]